MARPFTMGVTHVGKGKPPKPVPVQPELVAKPISVEDLRTMDSKTLRWHELNNAGNLNAVIEASNQAKRQVEQRRDDRVTNSTSGGSREAAERKGWQARELTYKEISGMSADESAWHQQHNTKNWRKAFEEQERRRSSRKHIADEKIRLMWNGHSSPEEDEAAARAAAEFIRKCPAYNRTPENMQAMLKFMQDEMMDVTRVENFIAAYRSLTEAGKLTVAPVQTADEFYAAHKELHPGKPFLVRQQEAQKQATAEHFQKARESSAQSGSTTVVTYPEEQRTPAQPEKYSFKQKIASMSADEFQKRLSDDEAFRDAVNKLK